MSNKPNIINSVNVERKADYKGPPHVWVISYDIFAVPIYAESEEAAIEYGEKAFDSIESVTREEQWDGWTSIPAYHWINGGNNPYGFSCAYCGEWVFDIEGFIFWTLNGEPLHGPLGFDGDDCYLELPSMNHKMFEHIKGLIYDYSLPD